MSLSLDYLTNGCEGTGGYSDIAPNATVTIKNQAGEIIATGSLDDGKWTGRYSSQADTAIAEMLALNGGRMTASEVLGTLAVDYNLEQTKRPWCAFRFTIPDLPAATFYQIAVGHRDPTTYSTAQMNQSNWAVVLTLGP